MKTEEIRDSGEDPWLENISSDALFSHSLPDPDRVARHEVSNWVNTGFYRDLGGEIIEWEADIEVKGDEFSLSPTDALDIVERFQEEGVKGLEADIESVEELLDIIVQATEVPKNVRKVGYEAAVISSAIKDYERVYNWGFEDSQNVSVGELLRGVGYHERELFNGINEEGERKEGEVVFDVDEMYEDVKLKGSKALQLIPHSLGLLNSRKHAGMNTYDGETVPRLNFDIEVDEEKVYLDIYDNGPGIDFENVSIEELKEYSDDGGLGIPFCNELVEMAGGELEIKDREELDGEKGAWYRVIFQRYSQ